MSQIRSKSLHYMHQILGSTTKDYKNRSNIGKYGLQFGVYHLAVTRDGDAIWELSCLFGGKIRGEVEITSFGVEGFGCPQCGEVMMLRDRRWAKVRM